MSAQRPIYRREFYRKENPDERFKDFVAEPEFAEKNFVDYFGGTWLPAHPNALTLDDLLKNFYEESINSDKVVFTPYAVSDGSLVPFTDENAAWLKQSVRFVTIVAGNEDGYPAPFQIGCWTLCIVGSGHPKDESMFLQVASWDDTRFRYYGREHINDPSGKGETPLRWIFQGDSTMAFGNDDPALDQSYLGPFNGHVNGSLVMKELHDPWLHWYPKNSWLHNMSYEVLKTFDEYPYLSEQDHSKPSLPWWDRFAKGILSRVGSASDLEVSIKAGINSWYDARQRADFKVKGKPKTEVTNVKRWLAHILLTTTINITCSTANNSCTRPGNQYNLPLSHFYNVELFQISAAGDISPTISTKNALMFSEESYGAAIDKIRLVLALPCPAEDEPQPDYTKYPKIGKIPIFDEVVGMFMVQPGEGQDVYFTALQPSYEDTQAATVLLTMKTPMLSKECIFALLMVDPYNPVYSWRRGVLMQYVPNTTTLEGSTYDLEQNLVSAVLASKRFREEQDSPEREFIRNLYLQRNGTCDADFSTRMNEYLQNIMTRLQNDPDAALLDYLKLAESRRRLYRPVPLDEFALTLPWAYEYNEEVPLEMTKDGTVVPMPRRGAAFMKDWIGSLASWDPQVLPKPDADSDLGATLLDSENHTSVLQIGCQNSRASAYNRGGGCPFLATKSKQRKRG